MDADRERRPGGHTSRHRSRRCRPSSAPPISPSRSAATAIWRPASIRSDPRRSAIRRCPREAHGITDDDLKRLPASLVGGPVAETSANAFDAIEKLRAIYCSTTGFDFAHVFVPEEREWLRHAAEQARFLPPMDDEQRRGAARSHHAGRGLRALPAPHVSRARRASRSKGSTCSCRCSTRSSAAPPTRASRHTMLGMAHRGRLNVLAHVLEKPYAQILAEFKDPVQTQTWRIDLGWMGDVKYHAGARTAAPRGQMYVTMAPNPSHLEAVNPVVVGMARAAGTNAVESGRAGVRRRRHAADPDSRRRGVPRSGHRRRDAEPVAPRRLRHRRHDSHHREQPARVHRDARRVLQHQLRERARARVQDPDRARQRRRSGRLPRGRAPGLGVSRAVPPRLPDRPGRLSPLRPQRGRRAGVHAAADVQDHRQRIRPCASCWPQTLVKQGKIPPEKPDELVKKHFATLEKAFASLKPEEDFVAPIPEPVPPGSPARRQRACRSTASARSTTRCVRAPDGFTFHKKLERAREKRERRAGQPERAHRRLGDGRGAGARHDPRRRHPDPVDRRGRRARHVQPSPRGVPRREHRQAVRAAAGVPAGAGVVRDPQQPADRERHDRLRVRLQHPGARSPRDLGSAVRRLHQRRAGDARPVRHLRPRQVGTEAVARASCCRTATRARARSTRARGPSAFCRRPPTSTCGS